MSIENFKTFDPFADADEDTSRQTKHGQKDIHIRIQLRNGRKTLTTVQGLPSKYDQKSIISVLKKDFACNGTVIMDSEMGEVIQLQGDQRRLVKDFLLRKPVKRKNQKTIEGLGLEGYEIKIHGF